jgi:hypothetical protein
MIDECGVVGGMRIGRGNRSTQRKSVPVPFCPPQIPHDLTWDRTWIAVAGSQQLTAWTMARPLTAVTMKSTVFWDVTPCSLVEIFGGMYSLYFKGQRITLHSSETSVNFYQITRCHIPEDSTLQYLSCSQFFVYIPQMQEGSYKKCFRPLTYLWDLQSLSVFYTLLFFLLLSQFCMEKEVHHFFSLYSLNKPEDSKVQGT